MAAEQQRVVGQREKLPANGGDQRLEVAVGKVGPPNAAGKDHVADEGHHRLLFAAQVDDVAGGMARHGADFQVDARRLTTSPSRTVASAGGLTSGMPKAAERFKSGSVSFAASPAPMNSRQSGQRRFKAALPAMWSAWPWVRRMAAGVKWFFLQIGEDFFRLQARIDHQAIAAAFTPDEVGVFAETGGDDAVDLDGGGRHELISPGRRELGKMCRLSRTRRARCGTAGTNRILEAKHCNPAKPNTRYVEEEGKDRSPGGSFFPLVERQGPNSSTGRMHRPRRVFLMFRHERISWIWLPALLACTVWTLPLWAQRRAGQGPAARGGTAAGGDTQAGAYHRPVRVAERSEIAAPPAEVGLRPGDPKEHPLMPALRWARDGLKHIETIKDYSATVVKRERLGNKLGDYEYMFIKVRHQPFSVYMYFLGPAGRERARR